jgi:hypothetical protein
MNALYTASSSVVSGSLLSAGFSPAAQLAMAKNMTNIERNNLFIVILPPNTRSHITT